MSDPSVVIVGSINMDLVARAGHVPAPGETVLGRDFCTIPGGKGANQAVAARRLGAEVRFIGCVGDDPFGPQLRQGIAAAGIGVGIDRLVMLLANKHSIRDVILFPHMRPAKGRESGDGSQEVEAPRSGSAFTGQTTVPLALNFAAIHRGC